MSLFMVVLAFDQFALISLTSSMSRFKLIIIILAFFNASAAFFFFNYVRWMDYTFINSYFFMQLTYFDLMSIAGSKSSSTLKIGTLYLWCHNFYSQANKISFKYCNSSSYCPYPGLPIVGAVLAGAGFAWLVFYCRKRRVQRLGSQSTQITSKNISTPPSSNNPLSSPKFTRSIPSYPTSKSDLGRGSTYFGAQVFDYAELEEATDNFNSSRELGDGGFGTVYYGKKAHPMLFF